MATRRSYLPSLIFVAASAAMFAGVSAWAAINPQTDQTPVSIVDYNGFEALTDDVSDYRQSRLIALDQFKARAATGQAIILDTRSAADFRAGHIKGAINLPFSEFTEEKLADVIGETDQEILIYCNNNFRDDVAPVMLKRAPLALNIPTFINLVGYGYDNVYELSELVSLDDPRLGWVAGAPTQLSP